MGRKGNLRANDALYHAPYNIAAAVDIGEATGIDPVPTGADGAAIINNVFFPLSRVAGDPAVPAPADVH
jgi:hypothetical protein